MFWTVVLCIVVFVIVAGSVLAVWSEWDEKRRKAAQEERNQRILEEQRIDRENRDFIAGHTSGLYGDYTPVDPETGQPLEVTHRERQRLSSKDFRHQFKQDNRPTP